MELDFDKEIDALLRGQARLSGGNDLTAARNGGMPAGEHLNADELAAYAENAVAGHAKEAYTLHLADCDRCRKILSGFILLDEAAEETDVAAAAAPVLETTVPWYRRLFLFPHLAYIMGGLVLVLGGFLAFQVVQNAGDSTTGEVSQIAEQEIPASGPNLGDEPTVFSTNAANIAANPASIANTNTASISDSRRAAANANTNTSGTLDVAAQPRTSSTPASETGIAADGLDLARGSTVSSPPPVLAAESDQTKARQSEPVAKRVPPGKEEARSRAVELRQMNDLPGVGAKESSKDEKKAAGPSRNQQMQFPNVLSESSEVAPQRKLSGKTFELKQGVWYDSNYQGSATTNVRRGTPEYRKLDRGLRSIADTLGGTVVVVWKNKAYRVQ